MLFYAISTRYSRISCK